MAGQKKNIASIIIVILLTIILQGSAGWTQVSQGFNTNEDTGFYYTIQKGDTLWDLSQKFYNSQWDWPGLWEINKDIKNPHWIYPGKKIRIYLKSQLKRQAQPQTKAVTKSETKTPPVPVTPRFNYPAIDRIGFIRKTEETVLGTIIREQDGNLVMSTNDIIYIKPGAGMPLIPQERYQIFATETVKQKINGTPFQGIKHLIKAEIKVTEINERYAKAVIQKSYRDATVGDKIMAYARRDTVFTIQNNPEPIDGAILCSEDNEKMVNDHQIAFINKGANDNVYPGQIYSILQTQENISVHDTDDVTLLDPLDSGRLIILHTEADNSTVIILSSKRDIHPGDIVN